MFKPGDIITSRKPDSTIQYKVIDNTVSLIALVISTFRDSKVGAIVRLTRPEEYRKIE